MVELLLLVLVVGLEATGLAALVRASPWPAAWLARKPLSCNICLGGHGAWLAMLIDLRTLRTVLDTPGLVVPVYFGATAIAAYLLTQLFPAPLDFGADS